MSHPYNEVGSLYNIITNYVKDLLSNINPINISKHSNPEPIYIPQSRPIQQKQSYIPLPMNGIKTICGVVSSVRAFTIPLIRSDVPAITTISKRVKAIREYSDPIALVDAGPGNARLKISTLSKGSLWLRIDYRSIDKLGVEKLVKTITSVVPGKRIVVQDVVSLGSVSSYFDAQDLYESLIAILCFTSVTETPYGLVIVFSQRCAQEIANKPGKSLDQAIADIIGKLRDTAPLLKKYIPSQEFLVIFINVYPMVPLAAKPGDVEKVSSEPTNNISTESISIIHRQNTTFTNDSSSMWYREYLLIIAFAITLNRIDIHSFSSHCVSYYSTNVVEGEINEMNHFHIT